MSGLNQVGGLAVGVHCHLNGASAIGRGDAGRHARGGLNGDGEGGGIDRAVVRGHGGQFQKITALFGEGQADQAATKARHEVDRLRAHAIGSEHQVAFVFAVLFIHQNHHAAIFHLLNDHLHA